MKYLIANRIVKAFSKELVKSLGLQNRIHFITANSKKCLIYKRAMKTPPKAFGFQGLTERLYSKKLNRKVAICSIYYDNHDSLVELINTIYHEALHAISWNNDFFNKKLSHNKEEQFIRQLSILNEAIMSLIFKHYKNYLCKIN